MTLVPDAPPGPELVDREAPDGRIPSSVSIDTASFIAKSSSSSSRIRRVAYTSSTATVPSVQGRSSASMRSRRVPPTDGGSGDTQLAGCHVPVGRARGRARGARCVLARHDRTSLARSGSQSPSEPNSGHDNCRAVLLNSPANYETMGTVSRNTRQPVLAIDRVKEV